MRYYDITPLISTRLAVFPGDVPYTQTVSLDFKKGNHLLLSSISTTLHIGAHADSSSHYHKQGASVDQRKLEAYFGTCQVIEVANKKRNERIYPTDIHGISIQAPRILFKTNSFPNPEVWNSDFNSLSPELIHELADKKMILIGLDTPSVDPETSKNLESHQALFARNISVLEGLDLHRVPPGLYKLVAMPLKIEMADASPVRAILIEEESTWIDSGLQEI